MSNEREQDDAFPSTGTATAQPVPPISQGKDSSTHPASHRPPAAQMEAEERASSADTGAAKSPNTRKTIARKTKQAATNADVAGEHASTEPTQLQRSLSNHAATDQEDFTNIDGESSVAAKPKRSRRKPTPTNKVTQPGNDPLPIRATAVPLQGMPPITREAIAFLSNADATASDLFKLAPDSQAFVQYHVTNMQRLEANSALTHTYLLATAPKYSPRFEKAADALVSKLALNRPPLIEVPGSAPLETQPAATQAEKANIHYGPRQASMLAQPATSFSLKKSGSHAAGDPSHKQLQENTIKLGFSVEQTQGLAEASHQPSLSRKDTTGPGGGPVLRGMKAALHATTNWLLGDSEKVRIDTAASAPGSTKKLESPPMDRSTIVPDKVARRFLKVDRDYYFPDRTPAFSDRGNKLAMRGEHPEVVRSLVDIATARGWENITVKGTESFRRAVWMEASQSGLKVAGYQPTAVDLADLSSRPAGNVLEKGEAKNCSDVSPKTVEKAAATRVKTSKVGQATPGLDANDISRGVELSLAAKADAFEKDKPSSVVKNHPDLAPAYGIIDAAKKFAESNLPESARDEFIGLARRHVINNIISSGTVIGPKVYIGALKEKKPIGRVQVTADKPSDPDKAPRTKEIAREK
jgi:hypothetical protein